MNLRFVALAIAALGWLVAGLIAFVFVTWFTFGGIAVIGLLLWYICTRMELEKDAPAQLIANQFQARQQMSHDERQKHRAEQSLALQSIRFFRLLGIALTTIGAAGFLWSYA